ncbi:MAG: hypothetical protein LC101_03910 [Flavobacteriales bacterium]|nr:hypothetical protein [Flavobacteriales bacterium]
MTVQAIYQRRRKNIRIQYNPIMVPQRFQTTNGDIDVHYTFSGEKTYTVDNRVQPIPVGGHLPIQRWYIGALEIENGFRKIHHHPEGERRRKDGNPSFQGSETERNASPYLHEVESKHFGGTKKCFCGNICGLTNSGHPLRVRDPGPSGQYGCNI